MIIRYHLFALCLLVAISVFAPYPVVCAVEEEPSRTMAQAPSREFESTVQEKEETEPAEKEECAAESTAQDREADADPSQNQEKPKEPVKPVIVTFMDEDTELFAIEIPAGSAPAVVPTHKTNGESISGWVAEGRMVKDPSAVPLTADTVYTVLKMPRLNSITHDAYIDGKGTGAFAPEDGLTRGEAAKMIFSLLQDPAKGPISTDYSDVEKNQWYAEPIATLSSLGVLEGYPDGTFGPNDRISRAEFVSIVAQFAPLREGNAGFADISDTHWAKKYIESAAALGWVDGNPDGTFQPAKTISRAEAVKIVNAVLGRDASAAETRVMLEERNVAPFFDVRPTDWYYPAVMEAATDHSFIKEGDTEKWTVFTYRSCGCEPGVQMVGPNSYMVDQNCQFVLLPAGFQTVGDKTYYILGNGSIFHTCGLNPIDGNLYYVQRDGSLAKDTTVGHFTFDSAGCYTTGNKELDGLVRAAIAKCAGDSLTQYEKLRACYLYLRDNARYLSRPHYGRGSTDWAEESASFLLKNMRGNCYCYAAAFCYMAKQLGYDAQAVSGGMGKKNEDHAWVMIDGRIFDPEIEYAHLYRYSTHKYYDCFDIDVANAPFIYHFPQ